MQSKIFFFSDIDDTLMQTRRKTDFSKNTIVGAYNKEGDENSFFYEGTKIFIDTLIDSNIAFVPTTARNIESYKRTIFAKNSAIDKIILNFGGMILIDGKIDKDWQNQMKIEYQKIIPIKKVYDELIAEFEKNDLELVVKIIDDFYISVYNKFHLDNQAMLEKLKTIMINFANERADFYLYQNDNSFGILPNCLNKEFAVSYLIKKYNPILTIGAGDNLTDLKFMNLTNFQLVPNNSSIYKNRLNI